MKNLRKKSSILGLIVLLTLSLTAQPYGNGNGQRKQQSNNGHSGQKYLQNNSAERKAAYLDLTDEQKTEIKTLRLVHQKKMLPLKNELGEKQAKMQTLKTADKADINAINSLIDEMAIVKTKINKDRAAMHQEVRKILTEEQRVKFDMHQGRMGGQGRGYGKGHGRR